MSDQVLLTNELDLTFPELKPFFGNNISATLLFILEKYTNTEHISLMRDLIYSLTCISMKDIAAQKLLRIYSAIIWLA